MTRETLGNGQGPERRVLRITLPGGGEIDPTESGVFEIDDFTLPPPKDERSRTSPGLMGATERDAYAELVHRADRYRKNLGEVEEIMASLANSDVEEGRVDYSSLVIFADLMALQSELKAGTQNLIQGLGSIASQQRTELISALKGSLDLEAESPVTGYAMKFIEIALDRLGIQATIAPVSQLSAAHPNAKHESYPCFLITGFREGHGELVQLKCPYLYAPFDTTDQTCFFDNQLLVIPKLYADEHRHLTNILVQGQQSFVPIKSLNAKKPKLLGISKGEPFEMRRHLYANTLTD